MSSSSDLPLSLQNLDPEVIQRFRDILSVPLTFDTPIEQTTCEKAVENLSSDEIEVIANISYAYWAFKKLGDGSTATTEMATKVAIKIARWHYQYLGSSSADDKSVTKRLKDVVQIRKVRTNNLTNKAEVASMTSRVFTCTLQPNRIL